MVKLYSPVCDTRAVQFKHSTVTESLSQIGKIVQCLGERNTLARAVLAWQQHVICRRCCMVQMGQFFSEIMCYDADLECLNLFTLKLVTSLPFI
jgi:hypothetical protein